MRTATLVTVASKGGYTVAASPSITVSADRSDRPDYDLPSVEVINQISIMFKWKILFAIL